MYSRFPVCIISTVFLQELSKALGESGNKDFGSLLAVRCDVRVEEEVKAVFQQAQVKFGGVDVCVNNAGLAHNAPLLSAPTEDWKEMLDVCETARCVSNLAPSLPIACTVVLHGMCLL
jgi:NADP-dependent 3-hydroxy acid dehydrogenase YdfG